MRSLVRWRLMFRVANRGAFDKCLARVLPLLGDGCQADEGKPYWKTPELWECAVVCPAPVGSAADIVLGCLLAAQRLAYDWHICGSLSANTADGFSGVFSSSQNGSRSKVAGLEWASFDIIADCSTY